MPRFAIDIENDSVIDSCSCDAITRRSSRANSMCQPVRKDQGCRGGWQPKPGDTNEET